MSTTEYVNKMIAAASSEGISFNKWERNGICRYYANIGKSNFRGDRNSRVWLDNDGSLHIERARSGLTSDVFDEQVKTLRQLSCFVLLGG